MQGSASLHVNASPIAAQVLVYPKAPTRHASRINLLPHQHHQRIAQIENEAAADEITPKMHLVKPLWLTHAGNADTLAFAMHVR